MYIWVKGEPWYSLKCQHSHTGNNRSACCVFLPGDILISLFDLLGNFEAIISPNMRKSQDPSRSMEQSWKDI